MIVLLGYLGIIALVVLHESLHAIVGHFLGIMPIEMGLGLPVGPRKSWRWHGMTWTVSLVLIGAFVRFDPTSEKAASRTRMAVMHLAGPVANIVLGFLILELTLLAMGASFTQLPGFVGRFAAGTVEGTARAFIGTATDPMHSQLGGLIGIGWVFSMIDSPGGFFCLIGAVSLGLGLMNLLPFPPLDGGMALAAWFPRLRGKAVILSTIFVIAFLMVVPNILDLIRLFTGGFAE